VLDLKSGLEAPLIPQEGPLQSEGGEDAGALGGEEGVVGAVVEIGGSDAARLDVLQRVRALKGAEAQGLEEAVAAVRDAGDVADVVAVIDADARPTKPFERIAGKDGEADGLLNVVEELRGEEGVGLLAGDEGGFAGLVELEAADVEGEAGLQRSVENVGLGEAEEEGRLAVAILDGEGEGFAEAEEVVGLVVEADETAQDAAGAAAEADGVLALFFDLRVRSTWPRSASCWISAFSGFKSSK
jgi:hypothetical protein